MNYVNMNVYKYISIDYEYDTLWIFFQWAAAGAPDPTCLESTPEQLAHICRLPKYPCIKVYPNIVVLARKYNLNNFVCFRFTSLEHGNTVYNANI